MATQAVPSRTMSLSLLDVVATLWRNDKIQMAVDAVRKALRSVPDVRITVIGYSLETDGYRCMHLILDVETDAGIKSVNFHRRVQGLSFTNGTWLPKRLLTVRVHVERSWMADAWLAQLEPDAEPALVAQETPTTHDSAIGNFPLSVALSHAWRKERVGFVYKAIAKALQALSADEHSRFTFTFGNTASASEGRRFIVFQVREADRTYTLTFSNKLGLQWDIPYAFDPSRVNVRIPIDNFLE